MGVEYQMGSVDPRALVEALRERGEDAAADAVERVLVDALAEIQPRSRAGEARGVLGALERDRARGNVSTWYSA